MIKGEARLDFRNERDVRVVMMQFVQAKNAPAQIEIAKERLQIPSDRTDQSLVNGNRHIVGKQRRCERRRIMPCSCVKHIRLNGIGKRRSKRVLMVAKFCVELMKGAFAQLRIAFHQKRAE